MTTTIPGYKYLFECGELKKRADTFAEILSACTLCPWRCGVNRKKGEKGVCGAPSELKAAKALPHFGEEPVVSGSRGSGAIFFFKSATKVWVQ
jgi:putative pyruvate formate lyase activating enzyme